MKRDKNMTKEEAKRISKAAKKASKKTGIKLVSVKIR